MWCDVERNALPALLLITLCMNNVHPQLNLDILRYITFNWRNYTISVNGSWSVSVSSAHTEVDPVVTYLYDKSYHCVMTDSENHSQQPLLDGRGSWEFPKQDTNLTLIYPDPKRAPRSVAGLVISSYRVELKQDSLHSSGYVLGGGVLRDRIALSIVSTGVAQLEYRFQVFGLNASIITQEMADSVVCS